MWPISKRSVEIAPHEAHVWAVPLEGIQSAVHLSAILSVEERSRAGRFYLDEPRNRFVAGRAALRTILSRYLGVRAAGLVIVDGEHGKPRLATTKGPAQLFFNVAHSADLALVAVTVGCEVGIDIERGREVSHWQEIAQRYFHDAEVRAILASPPAERALSFLRCWTAKEAILKALGVGLSGSLSALDVPVTEHEGHWVDVTLQQARSPARVWLRSLSADADYLAAIAMAGESRRIRCFTFPW
jgi:4'-phosphopantetheinyl transferase